MGKADDLAAREARQKRDGVKIRSIELLSHAVDDQAAADFRRAELHSRAGLDDPLAGVLEEVGGTEQAAAVLRQFMVFCLPPKSYCGGHRQFRAGFHRMVAFAWRLAPELLDGCRSAGDVAALLGMSERAFFKHLEHVDSVLGRSRR